MNGNTARDLAYRVMALRDELTDAYTISLGPAAVKCVQDTLSDLNAHIATLPPEDRYMVDQRVQYLTFLRNGRGIPSTPTI